jgi:hypothetical protein
MGHLRIKAQPAKHTAKMAVDVKSIYIACSSFEYYIKCLVRIFWNSRCKCKSVAGTHGNNSNADVQSL